MHRALPRTADEDPLPSFEKRQVVANQLNMTPRSVQIWFQNRRQRLLKPLRQAEGTWGNHSDGIGHGSPRSIETAIPSPREMPNDSGAYSGNEHHSAQANALAAAAAHEQQQQAYPVLAQFLARNLSAAIQFEAERGGRSSGTSAQPRVDAQAAPQQHPYPINKEIDLESTLAALPHAVAAGHVDPSAAALLAQALQQQMVRAPMPGDGLGASPLPHFLDGAHAAAGQSTHSPQSTAPPATSATPAKAATSDASALDGLLLLSACANVAMPAESSPLADAEPGAAPAALPAACPAAVAPSPAAASAAPAAASALGASAPIAAPATAASTAASHAEAPSAATMTQGPLVPPQSLTAQGPLFQGVAPMQGVALLQGVTLPGPAYLQGVAPLRQGVAMAPAPSLLQGVHGPPLPGPACLPGGTPLQGLAQAHGCVVPLQGAVAAPAAAEPMAALPQAMPGYEALVNQEQVAAAEGQHTGLPMWLSSLPSLQQAQLKAHVIAQQASMTQPAPYLSITPNPSVGASENTDDTESTSSDGPSSVGTSAPDAAGNNGGSLQTLMTAT